MKLLAVDTATEACSVAVFVDGQVIERYERVGRDHTQRVLALLQMTMAEAGIGFAALGGLVCGVGPGSFAGVRIAVTLCKGFALGFDLPVHPVNSLQILAQASLGQHALAAIDARMGEVYAGQFSRDADGIMQPLSALQVCTPERVFKADAADWHAVGTAWRVYAPSLSQAFGVNPVHIDGLALPRASAAIAVARAPMAAAQFISADQLRPLYLRNQVALTLSEQATLRSSKLAP